MLSARYGTLWCASETNSDGKNDVKLIRYAAPCYKIDDKDGEEKIEIIDKNKKNMIVIDSKENKNSFKSEKDIEILRQMEKWPSMLKTWDKIIWSAKIEASSGMDLKA